MANQGDVLTFTGGHQSFAPVAGGLMVATRTLTSAEILTLYSVGFAGAGIEVLPAIPGKMYWPVSALCYIRPGGSLYVMPSPDSMLIGSISGAGLQGMLACNMSDFIQTVDQQWTVMTHRVNVNEDGVGSVPVVAASGSPLYVWMTAIDPTEGDGTIDMTVLYREITVP